MRLGLQSGDTILLDTKGKTALVEGWNSFGVFDHPEFKLDIYLDCNDQATWTIVNVSFVYIQEYETWPEDKYRMMTLFKGKKYHRKRSRGSWKHDANTILGITDNDTLVLQIRRELPKFDRLTYQGDILATRAEPPCFQHAFEDFFVFKKPRFVRR